MKHLTTFIIAVMLIALVPSAMATPANFLQQFALFPHFRTFDGLRYQGRVTLPGGSPIANGPHNFVFTLHDHETASSPVWSEARTETTSEGLLSVALGETVPLPVDVLATPGQDTTRTLWLEISVDSEIISPRTRLAATPFANVSERVLGDIETSLGTLLMRHPTSGDSVLHLGMDPLEAETVHLYLTTNGEDIVELQSASDLGRLKISNLGSSGEDGVSIFVDPDSSEIDIYQNRGGTGGGRVRIEASATHGHLTVSNIGSSGEDGVSIIAEPGPNPQTTSSKLFVGGLSFRDHGVELIADPDTTSVELISAGGGGAGGRVFFETSDSHGHLVVSNIGSSGLDGVSIDVGDGEATVGIEHEDIGLKMHTEDEGAGAGMTLLDGTGDSTIYAMNKAELVNAISGGVNTATLSSDQLIVSNLGSSGLDGVSIQGGGGGGGRLIFYDQKSGESFPTEMVALSLVPSEPLMLIRKQNAAPADDPIFRLEYDGAGRVVQRMTSPPGSDASAELTPLSLRMYDAYDRLLIFGGDGNGAKIALKELKSGESIETEIIAMSLSGTDPMISLRMPDAGPTDIPLVTYEYDLLSRRILEYRRSETGQPGDSSEQSSTGLHLFDSPNEFEFNTSGLTFSGPTGPTFTVTPSGDMDTQGSTNVLGNSSVFGDCQFGMGGGSVFVGGTFPGVRLFVQGDICATGSIGPCSDKRYKKNIETIQNPLEKVLKLRGVSFDWRQDDFAEMEFTDKHQLGLIAQEVKEILPEVVGQGDNGYYFVDYSRLTPVLVEAVKELSQKITDQEKLIVSLKQEASKADKLALKLDEVNAQIAELKKVVSLMMAKGSTSVSDQELAVNR